MTQGIQLLALKQKLSELSHSERILFLTKDGKKKDEAEAFLDHLFQPAKPQETVSENSPVRISEITEAFYGTLPQRVEGLKAKARQIAADPTTLVEKKRLQLELDIAHNQMLTGGKSRFDLCSYENPELKQTKVIKWFQDVYQTGKKPFALLTGAPGAGKTYGAITHVTSRLARYHQEYLGRISSTNARFISAFNYAVLIETKDFKAAKEFQDCGVLIVDDIGAEFGGFKGMNFQAAFDSLIDKRYMHNRITICTTNLEISSTDPEAQTFPKIYGERVMDRFREIGRVYGTSEDSYRKIKL